MADKDLKDLNLIGAGTTVEGKIRTQGNIRIDGKLTGEINATENLSVGVTGVIEGTISGKNIIVGGKVRGNITATEKLVMEGKAVVRGDVRASKLVVDEGALFDGRISMTDNRPGGQNP